MSHDRDADKQEVHLEAVENGPAAATSGSSLDDINDEYTAAEQKKIIWRIDRRLVTTVGALYCVSLIDRTNLSAAAIAGMLDELKLTHDNRYSIVTLVFFVTYIVFQPPSTVIVRAIGPRVHLSAITLAWGAVMIGMGFADSYETLAAMRILLGIFEAGFFPSCVYLLSTWYTRYEVGKRYSFFYIIGCVASAFSGILAFGLMQMNGLQNLTGWRWIFIVEGALTCALAIAGYWLLVDFPDSSRKNWSFLGARERAWIVRRVNADRGDVEIPKFELARFLRAGMDFKIWAYALIFMCSTTMTYALAYFLPIILNKNLGFGVGESALLNAPPYALAGLHMWLTGWLGDKYRVRGPIIIVNMILALIGIPILGWAEQPGIRYFGAFFLTAGANANIPATMSYQANNIRGQWKRAFCSATMVGFGGIGGIAGSLVFREQDAATGYRPGLWACITACLLTIVLVIANSTHSYFQNKKAERGEKELETFDDDYQPGFRYTL